MIYLKNVIVNYTHMGEDVDICEIAEDAIGEMWQCDEGFDNTYEIESCLSAMFWINLEAEGYLSKYSEAGSTVQFVASHS
jgi:hypothetical protein